MGASGGPSGRGFGISDFMSKVDNLGGIARKNRFSVEITPPTSLKSEVKASAINFLAKSVSFPARSFGTTTYRSGGRFGLEVPYETAMEPVSLTMLNTNNHAPRKFWNSWCEHIQSTDTYNMQYYKKFYGTVKISCFDVDADVPNPSLAKYQVTLHEAWPKGINAIELGWENSEFAEVVVDIAYSWWTETN